MDAEPAGQRGEQLDHALGSRHHQVGRRGDLHARRQALASLRSQEVVHKLFAEIAGRMAERPGGYTRIIKIGHRPGDAAEMVYLELVDYDPAAPSSRP